MHAASHTIHSTCACPACFAPFVLEQTLFQAALDDTVACARCGKPFDLFRAALATLAGPIPMMPFALIGAQMTVFRFDMNTRRAMELDLLQYGVPSGARILGINYTPSGPIFPVQVHTRVSRRRAGSGCSRRNPSHRTVFRERFVQNDNWKLRLFQARVHDL